MKPTSEWIEDWQIGENPSREREVSDHLLRLFTDFWSFRRLNEKSKTTRNRYSGCLQALGGYLVEQAVFDDDGTEMTTDELLSEHVGPHEGPLIYLDNETWQNEIDMVCRSLYKYMKGRLRRRLDESATSG